MKRTVITAIAAAFVLGLGIAAVSSAPAVAADKKMESPCAKLTDAKAKADCMKKEAAMKPKAPK